MWALHVLLLLLAMITVQGDSSRKESKKNSSGEECECVPYYLCDNNRTIITNGEGLLDSRTPAPTKSLRKRDSDKGSICTSLLEICCSLPNIRQPPKIIGTTPKPKVITMGCGTKGEDAINDTLLAGLVPNTHFGEFPWTVTIYQSVDGLKKYICTGSLVSPSVVATSANCLVGRVSSEMFVRAGDWDLKSNREPLAHQDRSVIRTIVHPEFNRETLHNDIGLIFLESKFQLNKAVGLICLPGSSTQITNTSKCLVTSWGKDTFNGPYHSIMRKVELPLIEHKACENKLRTTRLGPHFQLHSGFICAGGKPKQDTCLGDGGAPLVCPTEPNHFILVGVVSWGINCAYGSPGVYTSVKHYISWISSGLQNINE